MGKIVLLNLVILISLLNFSSGETTEETEEDLLNWCIDGLNHKSRPGPEDALHGQCLPWKDRSCCTYNISMNLHVSNMYNFDWDHCKTIKPMSAACRRHFVQDLCFYECEPNLGPWVVKIEQKIRKERAFGVPLCASDCDAWYQDCKDELTCVENWTTDFVWLGGMNTCPVNRTCQSYNKIFNGSAKQFCEKVWDHTWIYTPDEKPCMRLWFNGSAGNPNDAVAKAKVSEMYTHDNSASSYHYSFAYLYTFVIISILIKF